MRILLVFAMLASAAHAAARRASIDPFASRVVRVRGARVQVFEKRDARGRVVAQTYVGPDYAAFWIDRDGDGRLDKWEMSDRRGSISLREPSGNHFLFMDVERRAGRGRVTAKFGYDESRGDYSLVSARYVPDRVRTDAEAQDFIVSCEGSGEDLKLRDLAIELNKSLAQQGSKAALEKRINEFVASSSCSQAPFDESQSFIAKALAEIAESDSDYLKPRVLGYAAEPKKTNGFLGCLRDFNLDVEASRIGAGFAAMLNKNDLVKKPIALKCELSHQADVHGTYQTDAEGKGVVTLQDTLQALKTGFGPNASPQNFQNQYSSTLLHELIHYAGIDDELTVGTIQSCCGMSASMTPKSPEACLNLRNLVKWKEFGQRAENATVRAFPPGVYQEFRSLLRANVGDKADGMVDNFYLEAGRMFDGISKQCASKAAGAEQNACMAQFKTSLQERLNLYFSDAPVTDAEKQTTAGLNGRRCQSEAATPLETDKSKVETFCAALHVIAVHAMGADVTFENPCGGDFKKKRAYWLSIAVPEAFAAEAGDVAQLCKMAESMTPVDFAAMTAPSAAPGSSGVPSSRQFSSPDYIASQEQTTAGASRVTQSGATQTSFPVASNGPPAPVLGADPGHRTERQDQIARYIDQSSATLDQTSLVASAASRLLVPEAGAKSPGRDAANPAPAAASTATRFPASRGPAGDGGSAIALPDLRLPDPFGPVGGAAKPSGPLFAANAPVAPSAGSSSDRPGSPAEQIRGSRSGVASSYGNGPSASTYAAAPAAAGATGPASSRPRLDEGRQERRYARKRAFEDFLRELEGPYAQIKPLMGRPAFLNQLKDFGVQIIDESGLGHGPAEATCRERYRADRAALVRDPACRAREP